MLPPFVPPSARVPAQPLPLITEFVFDRGEQPVEPAFSPESWEPEQPSGYTASPEEEVISSLPWIDDFLVELEPEAAPVVAATPPAEPTAAEPPRPEEQIPEPAMPQEESEEPEPAAPVESQAEAAETSPEMTKAATVPNEETPAETPVEATAEQPGAATATQEAGVGGPPEASTEAWMTEERNSFDWQGAANLAQTGDEERRASEEWSSTDWDRHGASAEDRVVSLMAQVARRVRSGELHIHATRNMSAEAALAAVLAALLTEPDGR